jgi:type IV pilus assembly protein PilO
MALEFKSFQKLRWYSQVAVVSVFCGVILGLVWYQYLSPMQEEIVAKEKQYTDLQQQIAKSLQQKKIFEQFKAETAELEKKLAELKAILPLEKETDEILRAAQRSASTSGLRILRVAPRPVIEHEVYTEWPIDMEVVGTYHNMGMFLDKIRQLPRIVNISNLKISGRAAEGEQSFTASVGATYTATTFVYREEQAPAAVPPKPGK